MLDPAIESHYGTGYERSRLFPGGTPSLEFVRSMELLGRLLPAPPAGKAPPPPLRECVPLSQDSRSRSQQMHRDWLASYCFLDRNGP